MPRKTLEPLTEAMFYVLLCLHRQSMSGMEIANTVEELTRGQVRLGPGTLYALLSTFQKEGVAEKQVSEGRRIPYAKRCLEDVERMGAWTK